MQGCFGPQFFARADESPDERFYGFPRLVSHIDDAAIDQVGALYDELDLHGRVLDLMASWISHYRSDPEMLVVLGMNEMELQVNDQARAGLVHDLNAVPALPFRSASFDAATCCVSVDYLTHPIEVFDEVARVLRPGALFVCTFSNRMFANKAISGWLDASDEERCEIVATYFRSATGFSDPVVARRTAPDHRGDPLFGVWASRC